MRSRIIFFTIPKKNTGKLWEILCIPVQVSYLRFFKPKQDKNVNLVFQSNLPLKIRFHEWYFDSPHNEINTRSNDILSRIVWLSFIRD